MSNLLISKIKALCSAAYVEFTVKRSEGPRLHGFRTRCETQYHAGANSLSKYLRDGHEVAIIRSASDESLYVVTKLEHFLELAQQSEPHVLPEPSLEPSNELSKEL
jgi:hypothetical protein